MKRKSRLFMSVLFLIIALTSCTPSSGIRLFVNQYDTFEAMINDNTKLDNNYDEKDLFYKEITFDDMSFSEIEYYIGGTDYCINEGKISSYKNHDETHCESLHNREMFVIYKFDSESGFVIIYKEKVSDEKYYEWKVESSSNEYAYESRFDFFETERYNIKNITGDNLLTVRFKDVNEDEKEEILNKIIVSLE